MSREDPAFRQPEDWTDVEAEQRRTRRRQRRRADTDCRDVFADEAGQRVLNELIARFAGESYSRGDPHHTAYREGQRSVVEHIARAIARAQQDSQEDEHDRYDH